MAVITGTYNLCFRAKIRKNGEYPCKPRFYYIKVGFKGVKIMWACFRDAIGKEEYALLSKLRQMQVKWVARNKTD